MKSWKAPWTLILVGGLFALLAALAAFQYRWLGELSQGERERMQANLRVAADHFTEDVDRELARAYVTFQADALSPNVPGKQLAANFAKWRDTSSHPQLVKDVYLARSPDSSKLSRLNRDNGTFEAVAWPAGLEKLRERFERQETRTQDGGLQVIRIPVSPIDDETPALIIPLVSIPGSKSQVLELARSAATKSTQPGVAQSLRLAFAVNDRKSIVLAGKSKEGEKAAVAASPFGYAIVVLDSDYLTREFIPALAHRYFSGSGSLDYNVAIVSKRDPQNVIYKSDAAWSPQSTGTPDATSDLFSLKLDRLSNLLPDSLQVREAGDRNEDKPPRLAYHLFSYQQQGTIPANVLARENEGRWQLILNHKEGSLEAVVAGSRRRNLIISSGILLLLAISLTVIMLSSRRAQRLARQQMEFVAGVSHELRTPLAVICSAGENLADGVIDDRDQIRKYGTVIRNEGRRLSDMVEQVLEFAGIQSGRKAYNLRPVDVVSVIDSALSALEPAIAAEGFQVDKEIPAYLPPVMADSSALGRAIQNLIDNAMKYSPRSRWIGVGAKTEVRDGKFEVEITVRDKGIGIPASDLPAIFEPFHRGRASIEAQIRGNGLGLSLVKHIIQAHGGQIDVASVAGSGSSFTLRLPAAGPAEEPMINRRELVTGE